MTAGAGAGGQHHADSRRRAAWRHRAGLWLMLASGFAGLGYQLAWAQQCALWLGHEAAAVLAVVAAYFGGLALGALWLAPQVERSRRPARAYALCELVVAAWALLLTQLMAPASALLLQIIGAQPSAVWQWSVALVGCTLLLLPATLAMGASLPALARALAPAPATVPGGDGAAPGSAQAVAALYAANTLGAVVGVLATAFWLVPAYGLTLTVGVCAGMSLSCATAAWWGLGRQEAGAAARPGVPGHPAPVAALAASALPARSPAARAAMARLAAGGLLGIGFEVLVVRVLSQVAEDTVYTFALLLAVYLVGTAGGAAAWQRWQRPLRAGSADRGLLPAPVAGWLAVSLAGACLAGMCALWGAEALRDAWFGLWRPGASAPAVGGMALALGAEAGLALLAFGPATLVMGALFAQQVSDAADAGVGLGRALAVNTLGAALAPLVFGVVLAPALGPKAALLLIVAGYAGLALAALLPLSRLAPPLPKLLLSSRSLELAAAEAMPARRPLPGLALAGSGVLALVAAAALLAPPLAFVSVPDGGRLISYRDGPLGAVSVVEDADGVARLRINNRQQEGSSATAHVDGRQALLPLLLHPAPQRALFMGLGSGVTAATAAADPTLQVDAVELLPEVIAASRHFRQALPAGTDNPRLRLLAGDARRLVRTLPQAYDVVVADNFHPARSGSGALYTVEHFAAVQARLAPGGLFCQWLPLHQLDLATLASIVSSFQAIYPQAYALLASNSLGTPVIGLVGQQDATARLSAAGMRQRLAHAAWPMPLAHYRLDDAFAVLGSVVAGPASLAAFAGAAPINSDDRPVVAYRAPRVTYAPDSSPTQRLLRVLEQWQAAPADVIDVAADPDFAHRLTAYWDARRQYLQAGAGVQPSADPAVMLAQVGAPLLAVLSTSADFDPAREPLLRLVNALAALDPAASASLWAQIQARGAR